MTIKTMLARAASLSVVPMVRYVQSAALNETRTRAIQPYVRDELDRLLARMRLATPDNPCLHGLKVFAQTDEDGIFAEIFRRIPGHHKTFVEIGCGDGVENNTHFLALQGYRGLWVDGDLKGIDRIKSDLGAASFSDLLVKQQFVTRENVGDLVAEFKAKFGDDDVGLFSLDIDGNDYHVMQAALTHCKPQVICVEYNAKFPPPYSFVVRYNPTSGWAGDDYHGASLQAFVDLLADYKLVSCNLAGANAFFVRRDLAAGFADYSPGELYQPLRLNLTLLRAQHPPTLKWLRDKLGQ